MTTTQKWLSVHEVAARMGVAPKSIYKWRKRGLAPQGIVIGGHTLRFSIDGIEAWERNLRRIASHSG